MIQKPSILLVDDEIKITQVLAAYLQKDGYETEIAHDGRTALELFANKEFSLVVLDLMLPDICGEELCRNIRSKSRIPIIMLTAKSDELNLIQGLKLGADDYIIKPFSPRTVVAKIEAVLRRANGDELLSVPITFGNGYSI